MTRHANSVLAGARWYSKTSRCAGSPTRPLIARDPHPGRPGNFIVAGSSRSGPDERTIVPLRRLGDDGSRQPRPFPDRRENRDPMIRLAGQQLSVPEGSVTPRSDSHRPAEIAIVILRPIRLVEVERQPVGNHRLPRRLRNRVAGLELHDHRSPVRWRRSRPPAHRDGRAVRDPRHR